MYWRRLMLFVGHKRRQLVIQRVPKISIRVLLVPVARVLLVPVAML
jgi:hypothetical protein